MTKVNIIHSEQTISLLLAFHNFKDIFSILLKVTEPL